MVRLSIFRLAETVVKEVAATTIPVVDSSLQRLPPLPSPRDLLKLYKIRAQRQLSQNFLLDFRINNKIITKTGKIQNSYVCEVGPGPGNITRSILQNGAKHVIVIEKDRRFLPSLELLSFVFLWYMNFVIMYGKKLIINFVYYRTLACEWTMLPPPLFIIGNLPFNISTALIIKWLRHCSKHTGPFIHGRTRLTLTFQKEVALRMVANANSEYRSRLSIMCQYLCNVNHLFNIPGKAFFPKPEVDVAVVKFTPRIRPLINQPFDLVEKIVSTIFHHRQKFCRYGIANLFPPNRPELVEEMINKSKVNPEKRSFSLEMEEFRDLCNVYNDICQNNKGIFEYNYLIHKKKYSMFDEEVEHDLPQTDVNVESDLENHKM
ncbi:unnamed protein product [Larinioides sclopetarius]|uniref:rRNA adenine N(6)-methyltransferase n=1 Tax=Larinioides sclopetarius TaxID=280406 RepID=A0AAV1ZN59_9ARAC